MKWRLALFVLLQAFDVASTTCILRLCGAEVELNPLGRLLIDQAGWLGLVWGKTYQSLVLWVLWRRFPAPTKLRMLTFANCVMGVVAFVNSLSIAYALAMSDLNE